LVPWTLNFFSQKVPALFRDSVPFVPPNWVGFRVFFLFWHANTSFRDFSSPLVQEPPLLFRILCSSLSRLPLFQDASPLASVRHCFLSPVFLVLPLGPTGSVNLLIFFVTSIPPQFAGGKRALSGTFFQSGKVSLVLKRVSLPFSSSQFYLGFLF